MPATLVRTKARNAFTALTALGFYAKPNFWCCSSCALAVIPDNTPFVFWHEQDDEAARNTGKLAIRHGGFNETHPAEMVIKMLEAFDLKVDWNGSSNQVIWVS